MTEGTLGPALDAWRRRAEGFRLEVPRAFNFGRDVVDALAREPRRPALLWRGTTGEERRLDFGEVAATSDRVASALAERGVRPGDPVLVMLPKRPEWHLAMVGVLKAGALAIPCSTSLRPKDLRYRGEHSGAVAAIADAACWPALAEVRAALPALRHVLVLEGAGEGAEDYEQALASAPAHAPVVETAAVDPALVYYTSGTTGPPKAVLHAHAWTFAHRYTASEWLGLRPGERVWTTSDTGWAKAAYSVLFGPWSLGAEVFLYAGRFDPATELALLAEIAPRVFCAPPTEFRLLVKEPALRERSFPALRECVSAGEPLNPEVIRAWREATGLTIRDGYGQTETILLVGNFPGLPVRAGAMGLPMPGHDVDVIDEQGRRLPPGEVGDLALHGRPPSLFLEYWKDPDATRRTRRGPWYVTGDRARRDEDGYLWFVGRADDVIISAGYRIGPFEVESALVEHPDVTEAAAVAAPDPDRGAVVMAFVVLRAGVRGDEALVRELQDHVKRVTAPYKYPRRIAFVETLPKTVSGKIRRVELRAHAREAASPERREPDPGSRGSGS
jgi:acetyl-CoA synthetase/medium-chain acyl-CoA synthetase